MKELYIARHGQTHENIEDIVQGHRDGKLTNHGIEQANLLGKRLKEIQFDAVYSSDLGRAKETTEILLTYLPCKNVKYVAELKERFFGDLQGRNKEEAGLSKYKNSELYALDNIGILETAEGLGAIKSRIKSFTKQIITTSFQKVLVVGHEWINSYLTNELLKETTFLHPQSNASFHYFKINDSGEVVEHKLNLSGL